MGVIVIVIFHHFGFGINNVFRYQLLKWQLVIAILQNATIIGNTKLSDMYILAVC